LVDVVSFERKMLSHVWRRTLIYVCFEAFHLVKYLKRFPSKINRDTLVKYLKRFPSKINRGTIV